jgi:flagellum-specific ATP synthase
MLGSLARGLEADVAVIGLVGERGREVGEFVREALGPEAHARSVVIAATSDRSALEKRRAGLLALATAEHFRDAGRQVLLLFDSLTRFAEAHREIALAAGEAPALHAFPPSTAAEIAALCERAGPGGPGQGDITAVFTVLVAGSDMEEPVADMVRGVLDGHVVLDRAIAERGRFPAIDLRRSVSRSAPAAWTEDEERLAARARRLLAAYEDAAPMIQAGLYQPGGDPLLDEAVRRWPALDAFLAAPSEGTGKAFARLAAILAGEATASSEEPR